MSNSSKLANLIKRIGVGDRDAVEQFAKLWMPHLVEYILSRYGSALSEDDVEEIVQQTLLLVFLHANKFRSDSDISARKWIYTIASNQALKWIATLKKMNDISVHEELLPAEFDWQAVEDNISMAQLKLDNQESKILHLISEGDSIKEIATKTGITPPRVVQIISQIRTALSNQFSSV